MPLYVIPLTLGVLLMSMERWVWPSQWLAGAWLLLLFAGAFMMAFHGVKINRAALRNPTAPLFRSADDNEQS